MGRVIRNTWRRVDGALLERAVIHTPATCPEGLDVDRLRFLGEGAFALDPRVGHLASVVRGTGRLALRDGPLGLAAGLHLYVPPGAEAVVEGDLGLEVVRASSASAAQAPGRELLVRDERFVAAAAVEGCALRWILTPQYLSRRVFLHHDATLTSRAGHPVSWFHTTMFDVTGLPPNEEGESVFKMSYDSRTELNVVYAVEGPARVRFARHPYAERGQPWGAWEELDGDATYHLDEAAGSTDEEHWHDGQVARTRRNKHEIFETGGFVSLLCMFDPAATGIERHRPGEYSDYEPLEQVVARPEHAVHRREIARLDRMIDELSLASARGSPTAHLRTLGSWPIYLEGRAAQASLEAALVRALTAEGRGRESIVARWLTRDLEGASRPREAVCI